MVKQNYAGKDFACAIPEDAFILDVEKALTIHEQHFKNFRDMRDKNRSTTLQKSILGSKFDQNPWKNVFC